MRYYIKRILLTLFILLFLISIAFIPELIVLPILFWGVYAIWLLTE